MTDPLKAADTPEAWTFKDEAVADNFDGHVRSQLSWYDALSRYVADLAVSFIPRDGVVFDIGASTGNITRLLAGTKDAKGATFVSIEPSHQMARIWRGAGELWTIDAESIDYGRSRPDVAILFLVLMFMKTAEREAFVLKLLDAVKPGGAVIVVDKGFVIDPSAQVAAKAALLAEKQRNGMSGDAYAAKELSLRGEQRPTDVDRLRDLAVSKGFSTELFFRFGEFYGLLAVKTAL